MTALPRRAERALLGWPLAGIPLMVLLGVGVRDGATPIDLWLQRAHSPAMGRLLVFTDYRTMQMLAVAALVVALLRRRWSLVPVIVVLPLVAVWAARALKSIFGRMKEDGLAYPSGHTTVMVVVLGMLILAVGVRRWLLLAVAAFAVLGILGQSADYHYFTDTVGAVLLGSSLVCVAAAVMGRLRL